MKKVLIVLLSAFLVVPAFAAPKAKEKTAAVKHHKKAAGNDVVPTKKK